MATISFYATGCTYKAYATSHSGDISCPKLSVSNVTGTITIYAKDVSCDSGYSLPANVYVNGEYVDYLQSTSVSFSATGVTNVQVVATKSSSVQKGIVNITFGEGISGISYDYCYDGKWYYDIPSSQNPTAISADVNTTINISNFSYRNNNFGSPVTFTPSTGTSWSSDKDTTIAVKTSTRYITLSATQKVINYTYYARLKLSAPNGKYPYSSSDAMDWPTYGSSSASSTNSGTNVSITLPTSTQTSYIPVRDGYKFLGYANSSGATSVAYDSGDPVTVYSNSTYSSSPVVKTVYAVWEKLAVTYYGRLKLNLLCQRARCW